MKHETHFSVQGTNFPCFITTPDDMTAEEKLPMIVFLHGAGERGDNFDLIRVHGIPKLFGQDPLHGGLRVVTLSPQCPTDKVWNNFPDRVKAIIDHFAEVYHVDKTRISLTGISMGGFGTWEMGMSYPGFFHKLAPICGGGMSWRAGMIGKTPVWAHHGDADGLVPIAYSEMMVNSLRASGGDVRFTVYPGVGHDSWNPAYNSLEFVRWLAE